VDEATLDEELKATWAAVMGGDDGDESNDDADAGDEPEAQPPADDAESAPETPEASRARDESGKFVKAAEKPAEIAESGGEAAPVEPAAAIEPMVTRQGKTIDVNRPPSSWRPLAKAEWEKLPPTVRAEIHRREEDSFRGLAEIQPDVQLGRSIKQVIEPYRMLIEAEGGTPERAVAQLLQTAALFRVGTPAQKQQALMGIAQQYGIQMPDGSQQYQQPQPVYQPQEFRDPRVDQMLWQQEQQQSQHFESAVERFQTEADAQGKPLRPYFADVEREMVAFIPQIKGEMPGATPAEILQQAYDRATWAHPEIRQLLQQKQMSELEAARRTENQRRISEAKKAASVNTPRRAVIPVESALSDDDFIADAARKIGLI
jgi:hypothetical protein